MKLFINKEIRHLFFAISLLILFFLLFQIFIVTFYENIIYILSISLLEGMSISIVCIAFFYKQNKMIEKAITKVNHFIAGNTDFRIECNKEGKLYQLFHSINTLAAILNAHMEKETMAKEFLKNTIADISHQLKTPITALNLYNGILQQTENISDIKQFVLLSEQEIDRIETLIQNLLKITKLDAGTIVLERHDENIADIINDIVSHFTYRAKQEQKQIQLYGDDSITLFCDRIWIIEAISNIVKNAFDHTKSGNMIHIEWKKVQNMIQIIIKDNGCGIAKEDIYHIFKRFYRSRFSKDIKGLGLGLSLSKAMIELHGGSITVDSILEKGSIFTITF